MISSIFGVDAQEAMMLLQAMIGLKMINVDLSYPILETGLIKIISNDHYIGLGNDSNLLIVFYVQIMPDDLVMQLHRF